MPRLFRVSIRDKPHSVEGHTNTCTLIFNGKDVLGPFSCHDNTLDLKNVIEKLDSRYELLLKRKPHSVEGHTRTISVLDSTGKTVLELSTHDNMDKFVDKVETIQNLFDD